MKFLIDEDVPTTIIPFLKSLGHEASRVRAASSDLEIAKTAKKEGYVLISLDNDFMNTSIFPPRQFNIIRIAIHPPYVDRLVKAFKNFFQNVPVGEIKGLVVLSEEGHLRFS